VANYKYFGTIVANKNSIHEEIKSELSLGNVRYHSVQNLLSSHLLSKNLKIKIYKIIILLIVLYGCETWDLTLSEEHRLRVFEPKREEVVGGWRRLHNEELHNLNASLYIIRVFK